ncbi:MAG: hypothetical protein KGY45_02455 [Hadesarchaea archaeon]|nr:hypothetical protein [Hadesarchaea archaeon]
MIDSYSFGKIVIDGQKYTSDVIILTNRVKGNWWRKEGHTLNPEDLDEVIEEEPEVLIIGKGKHGRMTVPEKTREYIESKEIKLITKPTDEACKEFNEISKKRKTIAALHLTC